jgi:hypothetical protein
MKERAGGTRRRAALLIAAVALLGLVFASATSANNLDKRTMTSVAKQVAKKDCRNTSGCEDWAVRRLHRVSRHKGLGKIVVISRKNGARFQCTRQIVIKLDHLTGEIAYGVSKRRCEQVG